MTRIRIDIDTGSSDRDSIATSHSARMASTVQYIGVVSTIPMTGSLLTNFNDGIAAVGDSVAVKPPIRDNLGYKHQNTNNIDNWINRLSNTCDMIVTVGGVMAFESAAKYSQIPFMSVLGANPNTPYPAPCRGGVTLNNVKTYTDAVPKMMAQFQNLQKADIALFYNPNNDFSDDPNGEFLDYELEWKVDVNSNVVRNRLNAQGDNDPATFAQTFQNDIPANINALVVSADPFFQANREPFIVAANAWLRGAANRFICYPTFAYKNTGGTQPMANRSMIWGPDLDNAYYSVGQNAANYLKLLSTGVDLPAIFNKASPAQYNF